MPHDPNATLLSNSTSVERCLQMLQSKDRSGIAAFIKKRFNERYVLPFSQNRHKNGFIMMASACLMIEALESFREGWKKSPDSAFAFCQFFDRNERFVPLRGRGRDFYRHVRCGIMHQGETTGGWRVRRDLPKLFDPDTTTIDATRFLHQMKLSVFDYCASLNAEDWASERWKKLRRKLLNICGNTKPKTHPKESRS